jgi:hypothetical protein
MQNITAVIDGNTLKLTIDLSRTLGLSKSEKSQIIATTSGNVPLDGMPDVKLGINIYRSVPRDSRTAGGK